MKLIRSVVHPDKVDHVQKALKTINVAWLTVTHVADHHPRNRHQMVWRGHPYEVGVTRMEIDVAVHDADVDVVVNVIIRAARTGEIDAGYVEVLPVDYRYEISTGAQTVS